MPLSIAEATTFLNNPNKMLWVTENKKKVIGFTTLEWEEDRWHLKKILVAPEYRRQGHGETMIKEIIKSIKPGIILESWVVLSPVYNHASCDFHEKEGFKRVEEFKHSKTSRILARYQFRGI